MANNLTVAPYRVDTVMGASFKNSSGLPGGGMPIFIKSVYWFNPITIGDTFVLNDGTGTTILTGRCEVANQSQVFDVIPPKSTADFIVGTIASGTLYIYTI